VVIERSSSAFIAASTGGTGAGELREVPPRQKIPAARAVIAASRFESFCVATVSVGFIVLSRNYKCKARAALFPNSSAARDDA
jgi:hypothetical protein